MNAQLSKLVKEIELKSIGENLEGSSPSLRTIVKMLGPYLRKDNRKHFIVCYSDGKRGSLSYPKWLMEQHLGRKLLPNETVDHINRDKTDDRIENLQVLTQQQHGYVDAIRIVGQNFICPTCELEFYLDGNRLKYAISNSKTGSFGPFCSRKCSGKYCQSIRVNAINKKDAIKIKVEYTRIEK